MQSQLVYTFSSATEANRFLNELSPWRKAPVKARLARNDQTVSVTYDAEKGGFDTTASDLDDLAASYGGKEA